MDELELEWRIIEEAPNYEVSNYGDVRNRTTGTILAGSIDRDGYPRVAIRNKDGKSITRFKHRLVAIAFIPNPDGLPQVNHIDEDKGNPRVNNLEWCSAKYNINYGQGAIRRREKLKVIQHKQKEKNVCGKKTYAYDAKTHEFIGEYDSAMAAARTLNADYWNIMKVAYGEKGHKTHHGMIFSFKPIEFDD